MLLNYKRNRMFVDKVFCSGITGNRLAYVYDKCLQHTVPLVNVPLMHIRKCYSSMEYLYSYDEELQFHTLVISFGSPFKWQPKPKY